MREQRQLWALGLGNSSSSMKRNWNWKLEPNQCQTVTRIRMFPTCREMRYISVHFRFSRSWIFSTDKIFQRMFSVTDTIYNGKILGKVMSTSSPKSSGRTFQEIPAHEERERGNRQKDVGKERKRGKRQTTPNNDQVTRGPHSTGFSSPWCTCPPPWHSTHTITVHIHT